MDLSNSGGAEIDACREGAPKYIIDILGLDVFVNTLCRTLKNLPFVRAFTNKNKYQCTIFLVKKKTR